MRYLDKEKPPRKNPGGHKNPIGWASVLERIAALAVRDFGRRDFQAHLPAQHARNKSPYRVSLPAVAFMRSALVAPPERFSRSRNLAVLLPWRLLVAFLRDLTDFAALLGFFARAACLADLPLDGATWRACAPTRGFFAGVGSPMGH